MLVLTRRVNESIVIDNRIKITVVSIEEDKIRLGIDAPPDVPIVRRELLAAVADENKAAARTPAAVVGKLAETEAAALTGVQGITYDRMMKKLKEQIDAK